MPYSWQEVAEAWCVTLDDFLGTRNAILPDFEPFEHVKKETQWLPIDPFAAVKLPGQSGLTVHLVKSRVPYIRQAAVLRHGDSRVGFVVRRQEGCDLLTLAPELRGHGLSADLLLATRVLRASLTCCEVPQLHLASKQLFCGGCYSAAGLASARAAHRLAVLRALAKGKTVPPAVLADYPHLLRSAHLIRQYALSSALV